MADQIIDIPIVANSTIPPGYVMVGNQLFQITATGVQDVTAIARDIMDEFFNPTRATHPTTQKER